ncbi:MAG: LicD family protein [Ruminococcaceae bacterium]|nr:LicD family protein [Oscillospiraceae bacterium]
MNELQKIEMDIFKCFSEICEKLNISYFLVCGSALGAARHGGVIPWDDDFDVGMYREDYNKFMKLAPELLPEGIFLQNYKTDPAFPYVFAKLRNSNTTFIQSLLSNLNINHGIYIDIFPLDGYPKKLFEQKKLVFMKKHYLRQLNSAFNMPSTLTLREKATVSFFRMLGCHKRTDKILAKYERLISKYPVKDADIICNHGTWYGAKDYILKEYYGKGTEMKYEGIEVRVPEKYDEYLTCLYGDWRTPPPPEKQKGSHGCETCDTKKAYIEYLKVK